MSAHDWHTIFAFGLLATALSFFNPKAAVYTVGIATAVIVVKNSNVFVGFLEGGKASG
jgi:hypothetical protein